MVIDTSEIKVGWPMNTVVGTFERLHLFIGYKEGRMYNLTMQCTMGEYVEMSKNGVYQGFSRTKAYITRQIRTILALYLLFLHCIYFFCNV